LNELWRTIHGIERPAGPTATDAAAVAAALGYAVQSEQAERTGLWYSRPMEERVAFARKRLCARPEHDAVIAEYFESAPSTPRTLVTLWWDRPVR
jgi:hypothetical protein